jgi:uncharacterized protein YecT (DUF1311 family)
MLFSAYPAMSAERLPSDDPTLRPFQVKFATYIDRCRSGDISNVERSECLYDQIKALQDLLKEESAKLRKYNIQAAKEKGQQGSDEKVALKALQGDFSKSQAAWERYTATFCGTVTNRYEILGGTGGAIDGNECAIRHLVQRINELRG